MFRSALPLTLPSAQCRSGRFLAFLAAFTLTVVMTGLAVITGPVLSTNPRPAGVQHVHAQGPLGPFTVEDITMFTLCFFGNETIPAKLYQASQSTDDEFEVISKSTLNSGIGSVGEDLLNRGLSLVGHDFVKTNTTLLGHGPSAFFRTPTGIPGYKEDEQFNKGPKVSPFDRFGVSGMSFSSYPGEWKHVLINACDPLADPVDPKEGQFYEDRKPPHSTWEDRRKSIDVRTTQFNKYFATQVHHSVMLLAANMVFDLAKVMVVLTIMLIGFAFGGALPTFGWSAYLLGGATPTGGDTASETGASLLSSLTGLWFSFIPLLMALAGLYAIAHFVAGRSGWRLLGYRTLIWLFGLIVALYPSQYLTTLNDSAVWAHTTLLSATQQALPKDYLLCNTNVSGAYQQVSGEEPDTGDAASDLPTEPAAVPSEANFADGFLPTLNPVEAIKTQQTKLNQVAANMRSTVSCLYWEYLLLAPFAKGQFGAPFDALWANDHIPTWASTDSSAIGNQNDDWVGDAGVPLGNGEWVHNWAIYHISTQTDVHSPTGHNGKFAGYNNGVAKDWWRIVDALANYNERDVKTTLTVNERPVDLNYKEPTPPAPLVLWDHWVGNNEFARLFTAMAAATISLTVVSAPFTLSLFTAVTHIMVLLIANSLPVVLLLAGFVPTHQRSKDTVATWFNTLKRYYLRLLVSGTFLVVSIILTVRIAASVDEYGWALTMLLIALVGHVLVRLREPILAYVSQYFYTAYNHGERAEYAISGQMLRLKRMRRAQTNKLLVYGLTATNLMDETSANQFVANRELHQRAREHRRSFSARLAGARTAAVPITTAPSKPGEAPLYRMEASAQFLAHQPCYQCGQRAASKRTQVERTWIFWQPYPIGSGDHILGYIKVYCYTCGHPRRNSSNMFRHNVSQDGKTLVLHRRGNRLLVKREHAF